MLPRQKTNRQKDKKIFKKTAAKTNIKNNIVKRGGNYL